MKIVVFLVTVGSIILALGCSSSPVKPCRAAIAHSNTEYDVCIGSEQVQPGDRVVFFKERCSTSSRGNPKTCHKEKVVEGSVLKTLDEHLSTVKLDSEVQITEQMTLEKKK